MTKNIKNNHLPIVLLIWTLTIAACTRDDTNSRAIAGKSASHQEYWFSEVAEEVGLSFRHVNGANGAFHVPEIMGGGVALLDYDQDGDLDILLAQGKVLSIPRPRQSFSGHQLFRNELIPSGDLVFSDASELVGEIESGFGMGFAVGDIDNDGDLDFYITAYGRNSLVVNHGDGTFEDVTEFSGTGLELWSSSATFVDYDLDGDLDLYVVNYLNFEENSKTLCTTSAGTRDYCGPSSFSPVGDRLFRNEGQRKFRDVTAETGISAGTGAGLGVVVTDVNSDGWPDLYVANDGSANQLWLNDNGVRFRDSARIAGAAFNQSGKAEAGMGVSAGDFDLDGDEDLFVTHLSSETNTLYENDGTGFFQDTTFRLGLGASSIGFTGFGTQFADFDNDGFLDLLIVNGAVQVQEATSSEHNDLFGQANQLYQNHNGKRFVDISARGGPAFSQIEVSRGAAFGDVDNDGDTDVVVANNGGPAHLLLNQIGTKRDWLGLKLIGPHGREPIGALVTLKWAPNGELVRTVRRDGSYLAAGDPRLIFGIPGKPQNARIIVRWPSGILEQWPMPQSRQYHTLFQGSGQPCVIEEVRPEKQQPPEGGC